MQIDQTNNNESCDRRSQLIRVLQLVLENENDENISEAIFSGDDLSKTRASLENILGKLESKSPSDSYDKEEKYIIKVS